MLFNGTKIWCCRKRDEDPSPTLPVNGEGANRSSTIPVNGEGEESGNISFQNGDDPHVHGDDPHVLGDDPHVLCENQHVHKYCKENSVRKSLWKSPPVYGGIKGGVSLLQSGNISFQNGDDPHVQSDDPRVLGDDPHVLGENQHVHKYCKENSVRKSLWKSPPVYGGIKGGLVPIETIRKGDLIINQDGEFNPVSRIIRKSYTGPLIQMQHSASNSVLLLTPDHPVLSNPRPPTLEGNRDWSSIPPGHIERCRQLRRESTPPERLLWTALKARRTSYKFRRQHPIGPYIVDFYCREARLVVEIDGETHYTEDGIASDKQRDAFLNELELLVMRISAHEVGVDLECVRTAIKEKCKHRIESRESFYGLKAFSLQMGDLVIFRPGLKPVAITGLEETVCTGDIYDLEIDGMGSYLTEVCVVLCSTSY